MKPGMREKENSTKAWQTTIPVFLLNDTVLSIRMKVIPGPSENTGRECNELFRKGP